MDDPASFAAGDTGEPELPGGPSATSGIVPKRKPPLLPSVAYAPWQVLLWAVLPQLLLLWANHHSYQTIAGDLGDAQRWRWLGILGAGGGLAAVFSVAGIAGSLTGKRVSGGMALLALVPVIAFLNAALWLLSGTIPGAAHWILSPETVVLHNLTGCTPSLLYFGGVLCSRPTASGGSEARAVLACVLLLGLALVGVVNADDIFGNSVAFGGAMIATGISVAMLMCLLLVIRLLLLAGQRLRRLSPMGVALTGMWVGLLLPMIGLWVNHWVPFPYDFQLPWIYAFAAVNGVLLSVPVPGRPAARRALWLAQCAGLPFTLYFFVVFMPFLPLTWPGLIVYGGGLLVLVPACVLLVHGFRIADGWRHEREALAGAWRLGVAASGVAAFMVLPGAFAWRAGADRAVLHRALDFLHAETPRGTADFDGEPAALRRTLEHVRSVKAGKRLPLLSAFYDNAVFEGLMLPESEITGLSRTFLDEPLADATPSRSLWRRGGVGFGMQAPRLGDAPHTDVTLLPVTATYRQEPGQPAFGRTTAMVRMRNNQRTDGEFTATLTLPENAAVSGFWLHIGDERVPGRITERRAAQWVYRMIRDVTRRDPGILRYTAPGQLELRVFPLAGHETRTVEIEFLAPVSIDRSLRLGGQEIALSDGSSQSGAGICLAAAGEGASIAIAGEAFSRGLPSILRAPYLHFIIDWSAAAEFTAGRMDAAIAAARRAVPDATLGTATLANFDMLDVAREPMALDGLAQRIVSEGGRLPRRGGFAAGRTLHRLLADAAAALRDAGPEDAALRRRPVFMVVGADHAIDLDDEKLAWLAPLVPDSAVYHALGSSPRASWQTRTLGGSDRGPEPPAAVHVFRIGNHARHGNLAVAAGTGAVAHLHGAVADPAPRVSVFDPRSGRFAAVDAVQPLAADSSYGQAMRLWRRQQHAAADPSAAGQGSLGGIVHESRATGILTPATAYIAVESHAQWQALEEAERRRLKARNGLALGEAPPAPSVPEPSTSLLILVAGAAWTLRRRRNQPGLVG